MTKKMYVAPECVAYTLPTSALMQSMSVNRTTTVSNSEDIGFSKGYSGGVEDDSPSGLWDEE